MSVLVMISSLMTGRWRRAILLIIPGLFLLLPPPCVQGYVPPEIQAKWKSEGYSLEKALQTIDDCAKARREKDYDLYYAIRYIDRNAHTLYRQDETKQDLWKLAQGSWELKLAYEDPRSQYFFPYPDFRDFAMAYIMIDEGYFGKGIAKNAFFSFVAMGGPAKINQSTRQLYMDYQDFFINGRCFPDWDLSYFMRGYARNWVATERNRPPLAFTLAAVTPQSLVVRGSKTGGMAVFTRLPDMRQASYGADAPSSAAATA